MTLFVYLSNYTDSVARFKVLKASETTKIDNLGKAKIYIMDLIKAEKLLFILEQTYPKHVGFASESIQGHLKIDGLESSRKNFQLS